jgi:fatty-acid desaturase
MTAMVTVIMVVMVARCRNNLLGDRLSTALLKDRLWNFISHPMAMVAIVAMVAMVAMVMVAMAAMVVMVAMMVMMVMMVVAVLRRTWALRSHGNHGKFNPLLFC